jgi:hypothetical protein
MIIIAHRGLLEGPDSDLENRPETILKTLNIGFHCEIDIWYINDKWWLGHDNPTYNIDYEFLRTPNLWIHCKNLEALDKLLSTDLEYFWHEEDTVTLTSSNFIWTYPGKPLISKKSIAVMPEKCDYEPIELENIFGICTDYPFKYSL